MFAPFSPFFLFSSRAPRQFCVGRRSIGLVGVLYYVYRDAVSTLEFVSFIGSTTKSASWISKEQVIFVVEPKIKMLSINCPNQSHSMAHNTLKLPKQIKQSVPLSKVTALQCSHIKRHRRQFIQDYLNSHT